MIQDFISAIASFLEYLALPGLMQGASMAVITLLISFAIGIFVHHLGDGERNGNLLDLRIALDHVWSFKSSIWIVLVVFISPILMGAINHTLFKVVFFLIWTIGLCILCKILLSLYKWVKGNKNDFRLDYFKKTLPKSSPQDRVNSWDNFWSNDWNKEKKFVEEDFFVVFSDQIDSILQSDNEKDDWNILPSLLKGLQANIQNRNKNEVLISEEFFPKILEWHFIFWQKRYSKSAKASKDKKETGAYAKLLRPARSSINQIIGYVTKEALTGNDDDTAYFYFKNLEKHIDKYKAEKIDGDQRTYFYFKYLPIHRDILDQISKSKNIDDIWEECFPAEWKVNIPNLKDHSISKQWLDVFLKWSDSRILALLYTNNEKELDCSLGDILCGLFPDVDPYTWVEILAFVTLEKFLPSMIGPYSESQGKEIQVKQIIETKLNLYIPSPSTFIVDDVDDAVMILTQLYGKRFKNTVETAISVFDKIFTIENINNWMDGLNKLEYEKDSDKHTKKEEWRKILLALKKHREDTDK